MTYRRLIFSTAILTLATFIVGCGSGSAPKASIEGGEGGSSTSSDPSSDSKNEPSTTVLKPSDKKSQSPAKKEEPKEDPRPQVIISTSQGDIRVELFGDKVPKTVQNFLEYVENGFYSNTIVHYVDKGVILAAGGYDSKCKAKPVRTEIRHEGPAGGSNEEGTIAMARHPEYIHSATSQFFINLGNNTNLDYQSEKVEAAGKDEKEKKDDPANFGYCVFGKVVQGLDVAKKIGLVAVADRESFPSTPKDPVLIKSIQRVK